MYVLLLKGRVRHIVSGRRGTINSRNDDIVLVINYMLNYVLGALVIVSGAEVFEFQMTIALVGGFSSMNTHVSL